ncbi:MAG: msrB [Gammaproteobacteria bacterium]|jgi:peptide-methionine (R)-S-oxide reductase|nr:msrB [Gammaproteobacteria bacterium]
MSQQDDSKWLKLLTPEQYRVCRCGDTEAPFTGKYYQHFKPGFYQCVCCQAPLFDSDNKYDSGSGWPSFSAPISDEAIKGMPDKSAGMLRIEVRCKKCNAHLGHVFEDGPEPTGLRFCINSTALDFVSKSTH